MIHLFEDNLFFRARLEGSLRQEGVSLAVFADAGRCREGLAEGPDLLLVNLASRQDWESLVREARRVRPEMPIIGYGPHTDEALAGRALAAGCSEVVPNGRVAGNARSLIRGLLSRG